MKNADRYAEGDQVHFHIRGKGEGQPSGQGKICGLGMNGVMPLWIVRIEVPCRLTKDYAYSCILLPESLIEPM